VTAVVDRHRRKRRLPNPIPPEPDEALLGWVFRASQDQGYWHTSVIEDLIGATFAEMETDAQLGVVAETLLSGMGEEMRKTLTIEDVERRARRRRLIGGTANQPTDSAMEYFGHTLASDHLHHDGIRFCPECLREKAYLRGVWEIALYTVCDRHRRRLVNSCGQHRVGYKRKEILLCSCGRDLSRLASAEAPHGAVLISKYIRAAFERNSALECFADTSLCGLSLAHRLDLIVALMVEKALRRSQNWQTARLHWRSATIEDCELACHEAGTLLEDWPQSFQTRLAESVEALPKGASLLRESGAAIVIWGDWPFPPELEFFDRIIESTMKQRWQQFIGNMADRGELGLERTSTSTDRYLDRAAPAYPPPDAAGTMPVADAAIVLGVEVRTIVNLFPTWHLSRRRRLNGKPISPRVVLATDVEGLRAALAELDDPWIESPTDQYVTFAEAAAIASLFNVRLAVVVEAVLLGDIKVCCPPKSRPALSSTLLNETEFSRVLERAIPDRETRMIKVHVAKQLLKLNTQTFEQLVADGVIPIPACPGALDDRQVSLSLAFDLLRKFRIAYRIQEFCGIPRGEFQKILSDAEVATWPLFPASGRQLRLVLAEDLLKPAVLDRLQTEVRTKWMGATS
jgi:hypothetical protein